MDKTHFDEMHSNYISLRSDGKFDNKQICLFGHCNATEELAEMFCKDNYNVCAILDNNKAKHGTEYKGIPVVSPSAISGKNNTAVCIAARAFASMKKQLRDMGYSGEIFRMVNYDSFSEYSLDRDTAAKMKKRAERGIAEVNGFKKKYSGCFRVYCPFMALGDVFCMMSYLPYYLEKKKITEYVVFTVGKACSDIAEMFGAENTEPLAQQDIDEAIQAEILMSSSDAFIPHQDRPYVNNLYRALYKKKISLEDIYKYGVFSLSSGCKPYRPVKLREYCGIDGIPAGRSVIISPYAKSVTGIPPSFWEEVIGKYSGYKIFTNVSGEEKPLEGTFELRAALCEIQSAAERAGTFIGIRSGLCDVLKWADCDKTAVYPDAFYSDTRWKMEEIYRLEGWNNRIIKADWRNSLE